MILLKYSLPYLLEHQKKVQKFDWSCKVKIPKILYINHMKHIKIKLDGG